MNEHNIFFTKIYLSDLLLLERPETSAVRQTDRQRQRQLDEDRETEDSEDCFIDPGCDSIFRGLTSLLLWRKVLYRVSLRAISPQAPAGHSLTVTLMTLACDCDFKTDQSDVVTRVHTGWPPPKKKNRTHKTFLLLLQKWSKIILILYTRTSVCEWLCPKVSVILNALHRIYFISWKKENARIKFMNFSQKYMGSVFLGVTLYNFIMPIRPSGCQPTWDGFRLFTQVHPP